MIGIVLAGLLVSSIISHWLRYHEDFSKIDRKIYRVLLGAAVIVSVQVVVCRMNPR